MFLIYVPDVSNTSSIITIPIASRSGGDGGGDGDGGTQRVRMDIPAQPSGDSWCFFFHRKRPLLIMT